MIKRSVLLMLLFGVCVAHAEVPLSDFARIDSYDQAEISPDGHYLALRVPQGSQYGLAILDLNTRKLLSKFLINQDVTVVDYQWANPTRLVLQLGENSGFFEQPALTGEIAAIDADQKAGKLIFSWRGETVPLGTRVGHDVRKNAYGFLIRTLPHDPDHVLIRAEDFQAKMSESHETTYRVNVYNGDRDQGVTSPFSGSTRFGADDDGFIRYATGFDLHRHSLTYVRTPEQPQWRQLTSSDQEHAQIRPLGFSSDKRFVWLSSDEGTPRSCLVRQDLVSGERATVSCDDVADLAGADFSADHNVAVAAYYEGGKSRLKILSGDEPQKRLLRSLQASFPGQIARVVSQTQEGRLLIVEVFSDKNPGDYYLFDTQTRKADYVIGRRDWLDPAQMAERRPVVIPARDGTPLQGFLTLPRGMPEKGLPLVVNPHGGPFFIEDTWGWQLDPQMFASRGYAVLQVNFRGSAGFGSGFVQAGKQGWNSVMIDDITDAARWAIAQGYAHPQRLCIYGGSYGGYAAIASVEREPDLYRCAIGYAGVYDLPLLSKTTDFSGSIRGRNYFADFIADSPEKLLDASPVAHVDRLKAALLIAHGTRDWRAPFSQAESLRDALEARHYPFEWMEVPNEGHGFYSPEHRQALFERMLAFLYQQIGRAPGAVATTAAPQPVSSSAQQPR